MIKFKSFISKKYLSLIFSIAIIIFISNMYFENDYISKDSASTLANQDFSKESLKKGDYESISEQEILKLKMFRLASVDGVVRANKAGNLIIDRELRHWIDFYLSALGNLSLEKIRELMQQEINRLPLPARDQATKLLADYLVYKEALADYEHQVQSPSGNYIENLQSKHDWQKRLRRQILSSATVEAFWQLDELVDDHALEKLIIRNSEYNEEEKNRQLEQLEANLPVEISDFREQLYIASNLQNEVDRYREQGGSDETVRQLRIDKVGLEAADRLDVLENNQRFWQQRIIAYGNKVKTVNNIEGLSDQDKQDQLKNYREINFKANEQLRLEAALQLLSTKTTTDY